MGTHVHAISSDSELGTPKRGQVRCGGQCHKAELSYYPKDMDLASEFAEIAMARKDWQEAIVRWRGVLNDHGRESTRQVRKKHALPLSNKPNCKGGRNSYSRVSKLLGKFWAN